MPTSEEYLIKIQLQVQNDKALRNLTSQLDKAAKAAPKAQKAMRGATASTSKFGHTAQNAGYQIQDMVVQIQGGVDPMRAMSQQLPQMLVGFGAIGAAIGVVAALLPTLVTLLSDSSEELDDVADSAEAAAEKNDKLASSFDKVSSAVDAIDLSGFVESFQEAGEAQEAFMLQTLEFRRAVAQIALDTSLLEFELPIDPGFLAGQESLKAYRQQMDLFAESVGLTSGEMIVLEGRFKTALNPMDSSAESLGTLVSELERVYVEGNSVNATLEQTIDILRQAHRAASELEGASDTLLPSAETTTQSQASGGTSASQELEKTASAAAEAAIALNDLKQQQREFEEGPPWAGWGESAKEEFSIVDSALQTFDRSFDTSINGVMMGTQSIGEAFENMAKGIIAQLIKLAAYQGIISAFGGASGGGFGEVFAKAVGMNAKGNAFSGGNVVPFAKGGVVNGPTLFPMANGAGLMGEAGAEAIMPLSRSTDGKLGVEAAPVNIVINNNAPGVAVRSSQSDSGLTIDIVMQQVTTAIRKGGNDLSSALEDSYTLGRGRAVY